MTPEFTVASSSETGMLGALHLKRIWSCAMAQRNGNARPPIEERQLDQMVLDALGIGLHQAYHFLFSQAPSFPDFEAWIIRTAGQPDRLHLQRLNAKITGCGDYSEAITQWLRCIDQLKPVLSEKDLNSWSEYGYVILRNAVPESSRIAAVEAIWSEAEAEPGKTSTWYGKNSGSIMLELIQHPALEANRRSPRIHKAFAQLWGTPDLWVSADRCGFHPPQRPDHPFPGPDLHWDVDFSQPLVFGTQGILYLEDTPAEQGALTLVPGFHHRIGDWLQKNAATGIPHAVDLHAAGSIPVSARAGDMVIWHHHLPHGSRPNLGDQPRIVQYINMYPGASSSV